MFMYSHHGPAKPEVTPIVTDCAVPGPFFEMSIPRNAGATRYIVTTEWRETCCSVSVNYARPESVHESSFLTPVRLRAAILIAAISVAFYLCWVMVQPFLSVITWAAALAVLAQPLHARLERRIGPTAAALIAVFLVALVIVAPAVVVSQKLFAELSETLRAVGTDLNSAKVHSRVEEYPRLAAVVEWIESRLDLNQQIRSATGVVAGKVAAWVSGSVWLFTQFFLTFLTLFYFFRDRKGLLDFLRRLIPLPAAETGEIFDRIARTVNASLYGNLLVKLLQGFLGGMMFWTLGLPAPILCGAATALCAVLPFVGTALVWAPAAIFLALSGSWVKAVILAFWGGVVVGLIDNLVYPILIAGELRFHPLAVFFSVFGGLLAFGVAGVVLGPVILAITVALLEFWQTRQEDATLATED